MNHHLMPMCLQLSVNGKDFADIQKSSKLYSLEYWIESSCNMILHFLGCSFFCA